MSFKGSILLAAGVALAASLTSNAAPILPLTMVSPRTVGPKSSVSSQPTGVNQAAITSLFRSANSGEFSQSSGSPKSTSLKNPTPFSSDPHPQPDTPHTVLTPAGLATTDGILSYCAQVDRPDASAFQSAINGMIQGHDISEAAAIRGSADYAKTQAALNLQLSKISGGLAVPACHAFAGGSHRPTGIINPLRGKFGSI